MSSFLSAEKGPGRCNQEFGYTKKNYKYTVYTNTVQVYCMGVGLEKGLPQALGPCHQAKNVTGESTVCLRSQQYHWLGCKGPVA